MFTTKWQPVEKGIVIGCTMSPILYFMRMNLTISKVSTKSEGPKTVAGSQQPATRAFMDNFVVITTTHVQARWVLAELDCMATWAKMILKPKKSRCLVIQKGKITERLKILQGEVIPNIQGSPIKCLEKWYDDFVTDKNSIWKTSWRMAEEEDKSGLPGKYKCWIYQHGLLQRLVCVLTVYKVPISSVQGMERKFNKILRRWLGIPPSFTSIGFYIRLGQLQLPLSSVVEEFKVAKCRLSLTYRDLQDQLNREEGIRKKSGRKWGASTENTRQKKIPSETPALGHTFPAVVKVHSEGKGTMVQDKVWNLEEEGRRPKSVKLACLDKVTWSELWRLGPFHISFLFRAVYNTLPTQLAQVGN